MRIDATTLSNIKPELQELLKNLEIGDVVKGRILEILGNAISIRTSSGQTLTAALTKEAILQKGDFVQLMINNISSGKIFAELQAKEPSVKNQSLQLSDILMKLELPVNEKSLEAAKLLLKFNLPVGKETVSNLLNMQKSMSNLESSTLEGKLGLILSGLDIKNTELDIINKTALKYESEVSAAIKEKPNAAGGRGALNASEAAEEAGSQGSNANTKATGKESTANIPSSSADKTQQTANNQKTNPAYIEEEMLKAFEKLEIPLNQEAKGFISGVAKALAVINRSNIEEAAYLMSKDMEVTPGNLELLRNGIENKNKMDELLTKLQKQIDEHDSKALKEIKDELEKVFIKPRDLENKEEVKERLKDQVKLGEKLESLMRSEGINDPEIKAALTNLKDNIDFIKQVNQYNNYLQIPVLINGEKRTTDMYVFKDKKRGKNIDPSNATILIALDLKNLGHLESLITVASKNVSITFRVEDNERGDTISQHLSALSSALEAKGYTLSPVKFIKLDQSFNLIKLEEMIHESSIDRLHFDMKI